MAVSRAAGAQNEIRDDISAALVEYQPRRSQIYTMVTVLLLSWADSDMGCEDEIKQLHKMFLECYNYLVYPYLIPSRDSENSLRKMVYKFLADFGGENNLIVVYYGGHGGPRTELKSPCTWAAYVCNYFTTQNEVFEGVAKIEQEAPRRSNAGLVANSTAFPPRRL